MLNHFYLEYGELADDEIASKSELNKKMYLSKFIL